MRRSRPQSYEDKLPPHSSEAERGALACCLLDPDLALPSVMEHLKPDSFYEMQNRTIFEALSVMHLAGEPVDTLTIRQKLKDLGSFDLCGGESYLAALPDAAPSAANLEYYLEILREKLALRRVVTACTDVVGEVYDGVPNSGRLIEKVQSVITSVTDEGREARQVHTLKSALHESVDRLEYRFNHKGELSGLPSGFKDLDYMTDGLQPGEMIVIAARPSVGKSALAINILSHLAIENNTPCLFFSLEMRRRAVSDRVICAHNRIDAFNYRRGELTERDVHKITVFNARAAKCPLFIHDTNAGDWSIAQIVRESRRLKKSHGIRFIAIDYLQRIKPAERHEKRTYEVGEISTSIQNLAKELDVPIVALAQLNRESEREKGRAPRSSDIGDSGQIERDADVIGLLWSREETEEIRQVNLIISKQRDGATGTIPLLLHKKYVRFDSTTRQPMIDKRDE